MRDEKLQDVLAHHKITWQFNLSRAPWWGGMFERMVGLVKTAFYKVLKGAKLKFKELQDIITDIQIIFNHCPLSYCEDDIQLPTLTTSVMIFGREICLPEENLEDIENQDLRNGEKYLRRCKDMLWRRFRSEHLNALRERNNTIHQVKELEVKPGDVVMIKGKEKNRGMWKIGVVESLITGRDGVTCAVKLRAGKSSYLERAIQHLYSLELQCQERPRKNPDSPQDILNNKIRNVNVDHIMSIRENVKTKKQLNCNALSS